MTEAAPLATEMLDLEKLRRWIGRETIALDRVSSPCVSKLMDIVGAPPDSEPAAGAPGPLGIHWCLFPPNVLRRGLQADGHPQAHFTILPPVPFGNRMWAGGEIQWFDEIRVGDEVTRRSAVTGVTFKRGRRGSLCFVEVTHEYATARGPALHERQDIVYRGETQTASGSDAAAQSPEGRVLTRSATDTIQLFRYSALTGNAHRIHYDYLYATAVEGYPGLVVHGPLQATMLMQTAAVTARRKLLRFRYRATSPMFCGQELLISCDLETPPASAWTSDAEGRVGMRADFEWGPN